MQNTKQLHFYLTICTRHSEGGALRSSLYAIPRFLVYRELFFSLLLRCTLQTTVAYIQSSASVRYITHATHTTRGASKLTHHLHAPPSHTKHCSGRYCTGTAL
jgi:hypothetical protein